MNDDFIKESYKQVIKFFDKGKTESYVANQPIWGYGKKPTKVYFIDNGRVKVVAPFKYGEEKLVYVFKRHDIFPLSSVTSIDQHDVAFISLGKTTIKEQGLDEFRKYIEEQPIVLWSLLSQNAKAFEVIYNLKLTNAREKVIHRLIMMGDQLGKKEDDKTIIEFPLTIKDLASSIDLSRESTGRILGLLEKEGAIIAGKRYLIIYPAKLKATT